MSLEALPLTNQVILMRPLRAKGSPQPHTYRALLPDPVSTQSVLVRGGPSGGGDKILLGSLKSFGIFARVHVIFKLLPRSTPLCLPWLPQVNL